MYSVTEEQINELMDTAEISVKTEFEKVTIVVCKLKNGFVITEASGAVDPENYSEEIGKEICLKRIRDKLWELEGYHLQKNISQLSFLCSQLEENSDYKEMEEKYTTLCSLIEDGLYDTEDGDIFISDEGKVNDALLIASEWIYAKLKITENPDELQKNN